MYEDALIPYEFNFIFLTQAFEGDLRGFDKDHTKKSGTHMLECDIRIRIILMNSSSVIHEMKHKKIKHTHTNSEEKRLFFCQHSYSVLEKSVDNVINTRKRMKKFESYRMDETSSDAERVSFQWNFFVLFIHAESIGRKTELLTNPFAIK